MNDKMIEDSIRKAVEGTTPDMLDQLEQELGIEYGEPTEETRVTVAAAPKKHKKLYTRIAGIAAAFIVFVGGYALMDKPNQVSAVVGLDVNPSVQLSIDKNDKVIEASAINDEGEDILDDLDFEGSDISVAGNAVIGAMLSQGYLTDKANSVLVSVIGADAERNKQVEQKLSAELNGYLESAEIGAAILGECVDDDDEIEAFAEANGISEGKAWLIKELIAADTKLTEDSLLKLTTQELVLLGQEKTVFNGSSYGEADRSGYISEENAKSIALEKAGVTDADRFEIEFECDDGMIIYEVGFVSGGVEYDYDIDAVTGEVLKSEVEADDGDDDAYGDDDDDDWDDDDDDDRDDDDDD